MQATMCSRCGKNVAVIFITKIEAGQTKNEGLCLKCARELHIKPVDDVINKMGISDEDLENLSGEMMNALSGAEDLMNVENGEDDSDDDGKTATFPFLNRLFGGPQGQGSGQQNEQRVDHERDTHQHVSRLAALDFPGDKARRDGQDHGKQQNDILPHGMRTPFTIAMQTSAIPRGWPR